MNQKKLKILVVRFSSIGDIVLTTPVLRGLKNQLHCELHFLTKETFVPLLEDNPRVNKIYSIQKNINEIVHSLKRENYDYIIDLHNNLRTFILKRKLGVKSYSFKKLNLQKWLLVNFKIDLLPKKHVVHRYWETVLPLGVHNDSLPGEFYIGHKDIVHIDKDLDIKEDFISIAIGAQFSTKRMPFDLLKNIIPLLQQPIVLIGGKGDQELGKKLKQTFPNQVIDTCGKYSIKQSASIVMQSSRLITNDTGMMHIAACLNIPITSVWGNTVPKFGMYPYYPNQEEMYSIHEDQHLKCRPCSKIGFQSCPKKHFRCMKGQKADKIANDCH